MLKARAVIGSSQAGLERGECRAARRALIRPIDLALENTHLATLEHPRYFKINLR
jgi:hypothetical protein